MHCEKIGYSTTQQVRIEVSLFQSQYFCIKFGMSMTGIRKTKSRPASPLRQSEPTRTPATDHGEDSSNILYNRSGKSSKKFNPKLIFSQIAAFQSLHYFILSLLFQLNSFFFSSPVSLDRIFTAKHLNLWTPEGRLDAITIIISSLFG